jgi:hypothetical protein
MSVLRRDGGVGIRRRGIYGVGGVVRRGEEVIDEMEEVFRGDEEGI